MALPQWPCMPWMQCVKTDVNGCGLDGVDPSIWGKIMIPMYWLWLHCLYGLYGLWCKKLCSKHIWSASPMQCFSYDPVDMWCHPGPCQLTRYHAEDAAWWAGELGTLYPHLRWHGHVEHGDGWLKKSRNSIPEEVMAMATLRKPGLKRPV